MNYFCRNALKVSNNIHWQYVIRIRKFYVEFQFFLKSIIKMSLITHFRFDALCAAAAAAAAAAFSIYSYDCKYVLLCVQWGNDNPLIQTNL
jgi:hypothetical protein